MVQRLQAVYKLLVASRIKLSAAIKFIGCVTMSCVVAVYLVNAANAQTEFSIVGNSPDLETEYRKELDKWMLRAYEGDKEAQFKVGVLFTNDQFNQPDFEQAVYWYKQAANQDHVLAQYNLGHQYLTGVGVTANTETAMQWWLKAAKNNHPLAQFNVGRAYYLGIGLPEDHEKSREWFEKAANNEEPKSIDILKQLGWADSIEFVQAPENIDQQTEQDQVIDNNTNVDQEVSPTESENEFVSRITPADTTTIAQADSSPSVSETEAEIAETVEADELKDDVSLPIDVSLPTLVEPSEVETEMQTNSVITQTSELEKEPQSQASTSTINTIALYTNPNVRSVLISIIDDKSDLEVLKVGSKWMRVSLEQGFPVWVHEDYIITSGDIGTITGSAVNARSVPIVTNGTIVGKLNKNESVEVIDKNNDWYRITSPSRFIAWVKKDDFERVIYANSNNIEEVSNDSVEREAITNSKWQTTSTAKQIKPEPAKNFTEKPTQNADKNSKSENNKLNNNDWLFSQASDSYTLQLASFNEPEKITEFTARKKFINNPNLYGFTAQGKNDLVWTYFLYGQYNDSKTAKQARKEIKQKHAWIRNFGKLQQNRCVAWKRQLPPPKELNKYCIN